MTKPKDANAPSRWNMRIWDDDKHEWCCQSDKEALTYYGFDITGGEITEFQGLPKWHPNRHLIWEQSTGLKDKNGKEIYEGDIVKLDNLDDITYVGEPVKVVFEDGAFIMRCVEHNFIITDEYGMAWVIGFMVKGIFEVIGNIHESNMEEL